MAHAQFFLVVVYVCIHRTGPDGEGTERERRWDEDRTEQRQSQNKKERMCSFEKEKLNLLHFLFLAAKDNICSLSLSLPLCSLTFLAMLFMLGMVVHICNPIA